MKSESIFSSSFQSFYTRNALFGFNVILRREFFSESRKGERTASKTSKKRVVGYNLSVPSALQTHVVLHPYFRPVHSMSVMRSTHVCVGTCACVSLRATKRGCHMARVKIRRYFQTSAPRIERPICGPDIPPPYIIAWWHTQI